MREKMETHMVESHKLANGLGGEGFLGFVCFFIQIYSANIMLTGSYFNPMAEDNYFWSVKKICTQIL